MKRPCCSCCRRGFLPMGCRPSPGVWPRRLRTGRFHSCPNSSQARSYLEPPYCYDLNRWHGVTFSKAVNGRVLPSRYPFAYQDMTHLKVQLLRERAGLDRFVSEAGSELELSRLLANWANGRFGHTQPLPYPSWDAHEILDRAERGDAFWCTFKAVLFVQACNAVGLTARLLGINKKDESAHTVAEVYNNELRKWLLVDPWFNGYFEKDGEPQSALELHRAGGRAAGLVFVFGENGLGTEIVGCPGRPESVCRALRKARGRRTGSLDGLSGPLPRFSPCHAKRSYRPSPTDGKCLRRRLHGPL